MVSKYIHNQAFHLESGGQINQLVLAYQTLGEINAKRDNVIWVFHAISADTDVMGWWPGLFGEGCLFNAGDYFIICVNAIGSPFGSSKPETLDFPNFTVRDVVNAHKLLAQHLGISRVHTAIGGSFGGYQALEFAYSFEGEIQHLVLLASSAKESAWGIAIHESQRIAMKSDASFGQPNGGEAGMKVARSIAMLTYRTSEVFVEKQTDPDHVLDNFKASSYVHYQGDKFAKSFDALSYYYLTKCIDSHNIGRHRGGEVLALQNIQTPTLVIGFKTDTLVPIRFQKFLAEYIPNAILHEFDSKYGHDGFLKEVEKISASIIQFYQQTNEEKIRAKRTVLKFGGSSLFGKDQLQNVLEIVKNEQSKNPLALVVSARGKSTDLLVRCFELAKQGLDFENAFTGFVKHQQEDLLSIDFSEELHELKQILKAILLMKEDNYYAHDRVVAFGELISAKSITHFLSNHGLKARFIDAREIIFTQRVMDDFEINMEKSRTATRKLFSEIPDDTIPVITGYIASSEEGRTVTLGRNGSNYTATLTASFIQAREVQNWTDVEGVFSSNPNIVSNTIPIKAMTYKEANEMANFGVNVLHPKTILPLMQTKIPLSIRSVKHPKRRGTVIDHKGGKRGIKAVTMIDDVALVTIEGTELAEKVGIDAKIFAALRKKEISVKMVSQASSERGIGFVISKKDINNAELVLNDEFQNELRKNQISSIRVNDEIGIIAIIGRHNYALEKAIHALRRNRIWMYLISNSISGEHISLVVDKASLKKAARLVHNEVYGVIKTIHVFAFGIGRVGSALMEQILETTPELIKERNLAIRIIGIADSKKYLIDAEGLWQNWKSDFLENSKSGDLDTITMELKNMGLENIVIVDNTSSEEISNHYIKFLKADFDIVASNRFACSSRLEQYNEIKKLRQQRGRLFYYEANVGAGLPIIDYLRSLYQSSESITSIRGVFSGSLSYVFNKFSTEDLSFSEQLLKAREAGLTEADPRDDLSGSDVARKIVILAREINFPAEIEMVEVQNLIPESLRHLTSFEELLENRETLDTEFKEIKNALSDREVLRYIGELNTNTGQLKVKLQGIPSNTPLGQTKNADSLFEIYSDSYGDQPIIIQGAGAGSTFAARAVYSDLIRLGNQL